MKLNQIMLHQLKLPLKKPYRVSFRTYTELEPILVEIHGDNGAVGWGEAYIPGVRLLKRRIAAGNSAASTARHCLERLRPKRGSFWIVR